MSARAEREPVLASAARRRIILRGFYFILFYVAKNYNFNDKDSIYCYQGVEADAVPFKVGKFNRTLALGPT